MVAPSSVFVPGLLKDKVVFMTGGTSGINLGVARRMALAGARVAVIGRDPAKAAAAARSISDAGGIARGLSADVRNFVAVEAAVKQVHDEWGPLDILFAGAAGNFVAPATGMSSNGFRSVIDIDLLGTFNAARAAFPCLSKPGSTVVAMSASHAVLPVAGQSHVCAAKAGVDMLIRTLSVEWAPHGIRCVGISPGPVEGTEGMNRLAPGGDPSLNRLLSSIPSKRQARIDEIADLALFLVSGAADYINGAIIPIDGGFQNLGSQVFGEMLLESVS